MRIVGLDLSLMSTGVATIDTDPYRATTATITSKGHKDATLEQRHMRLHNLRLDIALAAPAGTQLVVVEGPSYGQGRQGGQHDRAGLWWMVVDWLSNNEPDGWGYTVVEVPPACRAKYATGKGNAAKDHVLASVVRRYRDVLVAGNDQADALVLAAMGARALGHPIESSLPAVNLTAMETIRWPETTAAS